eukprot:353851-Chlamydomonas_euryale.AAC.2
MFFCPPWNAAPTCLRASSLCAPVARCCLTAHPADPARPCSTPPRNPAVLTGLLTGVRVRPEHVLFFVNMMLLDGGAARSVSAAQFTDAVESCVDANKRAGGMYRMVQVCAEPVQL